MSGSGLFPSPQGEHMHAHPNQAPMCMGKAEGVAVATLRLKWLILLETRPHSSKVDLKPYSPPNDVWPILDCLLNIRILSNTLQYMISSPSPWSVFQDKIRPREKLPACYDVFIFQMFSLSQLNYPHGVQIRFLVLNYRFWLDISNYNKDCQA